MMNRGYVWIVTDGLGNMLNSFDSSVIESMQGVLGVKSYVSRTKKFDDFEARWKRKFIQDNPTLAGINLNALGLWAYDVTTALAMAVEQVGNLGFDMSNVSVLVKELTTSSSSSPKLKHSSLYVLPRAANRRSRPTLTVGMVVSRTYDCNHVGLNGDGFCVRF
ncbi:hypothetical protein K1719_001674 [Acacia pycnantha]|nr:hypothetical protein K1719_001674 [Acacia pycnantha]